MIDENGSLLNTSSRGKDPTNSDAFENLFVKFGSFCFQ